MTETANFDKPYIEKRASGWVKKVEQLYDFIKVALKNHKEVEYKTDNSMTMHEELMEQFGVQPKKVPIFDLYVEKKLIATFKPIGLWVVGAKGRMDILTKKGSYILVDIGEDETTPLWRVFTPTNRKKGESFDAEFVNKLAHSQ